MWIPMEPCAKPSTAHGIGRGAPFSKPRTHLPTPARKKMKQFAAMVQTAAKATGFPPIPESHPVQITVWCLLKRPNSDFVNNQREVGRLKESALEAGKVWVAIKPDVDNLAKFVLDAVKGILYTDDKQIVDLHMYKLRDSKGLCNGRVGIRVAVCTRPAQQILPDF